MQQRCQIFVVQLQGYLFFGNEQKVVEGIELALKEAETEMQAVTEGAATVRGRDKGTGAGHSLVYNDAADHDHNHAHEEQQKIKYLILDCSFVTGADVNAIAGLLKMKVVYNDADITN